MTKYIITAMILLGMTLPGAARETAKQDFLNTLFKGKEYPVALSQSESYPWRIDYNSIKTSSRQDDMNSNCWFALDVFVPADSASVSFDYEVRYHKETFGWAKYANLTCSIDGVEVFSNNGTDKMESTTLKIAKGYHQLKWNLFLGDAWENWDYFGKIENMSFQGISNESPLPEFDRQSLPFYNVELNNQKKGIINISNVGNQPYLIYSANELQSPYKILEGAQQTIAPGSTGSIVVGFEPEYEGYYDDELLLSSNVGNKAIPLSGISTTGYVVVSPVPGGLSTVLKNTNCENVSILGHLNRTDQYYLNKLQKCKYLSLAGTDIEVVTNGGINNLWKLKSIVLPKTLKVLDTTWANNATFEGKTQITLYDLNCIQCLSPYPPKVLEFYDAAGESSEEKELGNLRPSTRLLVPDEYAANYTSSPIWSKLTIVPIIFERTTLRVNLDVPNPEKYSGGKLHLKNSDTQESTFVTIDGNAAYSFIGLRPYHLYNVTLADATFGRNIGDIEITELDVPECNVNLSNIRDIHRIEGLVYDDESADVTSEIDFEWTDDKGNAISTSNVASAIIAGDSIVCNLRLSETLGKIFIAPKPISFKSADKDSTLVIVLERIPEVTLNGTVKDAVYKKPIAGASILVSQYLNGKYAVSSKMTTDSVGRFSHKLLNDSTIVSVIVPDYEPYKLALTNLDDLHGLEEIMVQPNEGVSVNIQFSFQRKSEPNTEPTIENWYAGYANVDFSVFNKTTNVEIANKEYKWPSLTLLENCAVGDSISILASSKSDSFYPVETICLVDSTGHATATIPIVEMGSICSSYNYSANQSTTGLLFGENSKLIDHKTYLSQRISFDNLKDGKYSLVTMGTNHYYNSIPSLDALREYQLKEGVDYIVNDVDVRRGLLCNIICDTVPTFDGDAHRLTGSSTYFSVNKSSVVAGNYVTIDTRVDFISSIAEKVKNTSLSIELPSNVSFVKNSLLIDGNQSSNYKITDGRLSIPISKAGEKVRFCLQPSSYGNYVTGGSVKFTIDGQEFAQPIGTASFSASSITISAPRTTPNKEITVGGYTLGNAEVTIYDNSIAIGKTNSSASGKWQTSVTLDNPYNHSRHQIYAKIETPDGIEMQSETKDVVYDKNQIAVNKVTMYHDNPEVGRTYEVEFNFQNPSPVTSSYTYYIYNKNFTFTIDLTDNDPEKVKNVVLWVTTGKGNEIGLDAKYDENQGLWVASGQFGNMYDGDIPVNVGVSLNQTSVLEIDNKHLKDSWNEYISEVASIRDIDQFYDNIISQIEYEQNSPYPDSERLNELIKQSFEKAYGELNTADLDVITDEEYVALSEKFDTCFDSDLEFIPDIHENVYGQWKQDIEEFTLTVVIVPDDEYHETSSFHKIKTTEGNTILINSEGDSFTIIDHENKYAISLSISPKDSYQKSRSNNENPISNLTDELVKKLLNNVGDEIPKITIDVIENSYAKDAAKQYAKLSTIDMKKSPYFWDYVYKSAKQNRKAAKKWKSRKSLLGQHIDVSKLWCRIFTSLSEQKMLARMVTEGIPELYECAVKKYPKESAEVYDILSQLLKKLPNDTRQKILVPTIASKVGSTSTTLVAGSVAEVYADEIGKAEWRVISNCIDQISALNSTCVKEEKQRLIDEGYFESHCPDAPNQIDPSGYVYEAVPTNRLQGVKATCYQKVETEDMYGDIIEKAVIWDARNYEQRNPLLTDEQGMYRWDVPEGLWQVKFEKEGYETAYTDWLPVPPPQLDINIPMVQYSQPHVVKAEWTENGIEICFNKYMLPSTINTRNIVVECDGQDICNGIELANEETKSIDDAEQSYASVVKIATAPWLGEKDVIDLLIKGNVKSYAGITLGEDKTFRLSLVPTVTDYVVPDSVSLKIDEQKKIHVQVLSKDVSNGRSLSIANSSPMICNVDSTIELDGNGEGDIFITAGIPGATTLTLSIDGFTRTKQIPVVVSDNDDKIVATPYASVNDTETIEEGTEIFLYCDTEEATIYYTMDGSCPCDYGKRIRYEGSPIIAKQPFELKIMACKPGYDDSEIATYRYDIVASLSDIKGDAMCSVSPKITRDYVYLNLQGNMASRVSVWNVDGGLIQTKTNVPDGSRINMSDFPSGMYFIDIDVKGRKYAEKIIKH